MKLLFFLFLTIIVCGAVYFIMNKVRKGNVRLQPPVFAIPAERVYKEELSNGMHVLVFQNSSLPKVLVQIAYDVGSSIEDSGERGLAHLIEHMIFKGTEKLSESDIDSIARKYGASFNAFTSMDMTSYYFEANKNNWKPFVPILADCMQNARFEEQHLSSEVKAVIQELKMIKDDYWRSMMYKACELSFPPNHPYHMPTIGFKEDLLSMNAANLKKFYKKYYRPDRASLFIVGDVDINDALKTVKNSFQKLDAEKTVETKSFPVVIPELMTHHTRYFEDVKQTQVGFYWTIPGFKSPDEQVVSIIDTVLGWGQSGRLHHVLVDEKKLATSVYVKGSKFAEAGIFLILIEPMPGKTDECEAVIKQEMEKLIKNGVTKQELERVVKVKSKNFFQKMQSFVDFTYSWIQSYFSTHDELDVFKRVEAYKKIDSAAVVAFAQKYLDPFFMNRIEVLPLPDSKKELRESIKRMTDELDQKILARHQRIEAVEAPRAVNGLAMPTPLQFEFPKPSKVVELANGLKVLLAPNKNIPLISVNCMFKDAWYLQEAREGFPVEVMMDMLMEGSNGYAKKDHVDFFEQLGATYAFDTLGARFTCLRDDVSKLLERFCLILNKPTFPREGLEKVKSIFVDAHQRAKDSPRAMAVRLLKNAVYKDHPFAWTHDQAIESIKTIDTTALKASHELFLRPSNMIMAIVGDFDVDVMVDMLKQSLGSWSAGARKIIAPAKRSFDKQASLDHKMIRDQLMLLFGQPSPITIYSPDFVPLKLLNIICYRSLGSRIYKLREQTGLFYTAIGAWAAGATREAGFDYVGMIVSPENAEHAEEQTKQLLVQLVKDGVTQEEVDAARQMYLKDLIDIISDNGAIAYMLCMLDAFELGFDYYDTVLQRVQDLTVEDMNALAVKYGNPEAMVRVRVGPVG